MARYTKSRTKLSRRVGRNLYLKGIRSYSSKDDYTKRPFKGVKRKPLAVSEFAKQLLEKQALKFTYGLMEKQLANVFKKAFRTNGDTGVLALSYLERRLDNVVYKAGLANSRSQARQLVCHGHFLINGKKLNIPSYLVKAGDEIEVKLNKKKNGYWSNFQLQVPADVPSWLDNTKSMKIKILSNPSEVDLPNDFNIGSIVEFYSRKVS